MGRAVRLRPPRGLCTFPQVVSSGDADDAVTREAGKIPALWSFPIGCRRGGRRVELDQGLRFLVGQPEDHVVGGGTARQQRVLVVGGQRLHLCRGRERERGPVRASLGGTGSLPGRTPNAGDMGIALSTVHRRGKSGVGFREVSTAVFRHAEDHPETVQVWVPFPSSTARRARTSAASTSALSVDGRIVHAVAARTAVHTSLVPFANARTCSRVAASSLSCPNHAWSVASCRERSVSIGLAEEVFARYGTAWPVPRAA